MSEQAPLAARVRPVTLDELVGQQQILGEGSALRRAIADDRVGSMILYGPPGSGKTTLARIVAASTDAAFEQLSAVSATVAEVRAVIAAVARAAGRERPAHDPLSRRDPPLQQGAAGCAAAVGGGRPADADRRDDREPVLRGERGAAVALPGLPAGAAVPGRARHDRPARSRRAGSDRPGRPRRADRAQGWRRRAHGPQHPRARVADGRRFEPHGRPRRRRGAQAPPRLRPRRRPALRLRLGLHQVDARLRSRCGRLLPCGDARRRRGRPVRGAPDGDPRLGRHRQRRPERARRRRRRRQRGRARGPARGAAQPGAGGDLPRAGAEVERRHHRAGGGPARRARARQRQAAEVTALDRPSGAAEAGARRGLRLSPRRPGRLRNELPAGRAEGQEATTSLSAWGAQRRTARPRQWSHTAPWATCARHLRWSPGAPRWSACTTSTTSC